MMKPSTKLYLQCFLVLCVGTLYAFYALPHRPQLEQQYSNWMRNVISSLANIEAKKNPGITITLTSNTRQFAGNWEVHLDEASDNQEAKQNALRLLELAKESKIFAQQQTGKKDYIFAIVSGDNHFTIALDHKQVAGDISLQTLLRLIPIYAQTDGVQHENT